VGKQATRAGARGWPQPTPPVSTLIGEGEKTKREERREYEKVREDGDFGSSQGARGRREGKRRDK